MYSQRKRHEEAQARLNEEKAYNFNDDLRFNDL